MIIFASNMDDFGAKSIKPGIIYILKNIGFLECLMTKIKLTNILLSLNQK